MILIDALYVNNGGGKILLDYLIEKLEETKLSVCYLLDSRVKNKIQQIKNSNIIIFESASLFNRLNFYMKEVKSFDSVFCFGNLPPLIKLNIPVYTYFHNPMYLEVPRDFSKWQKILYFLKGYILLRTINNTDKFIVQSEFIKNGLESKLKIERLKIMVLPFYPPLKILNNHEKEKNSFLFVSNATPNKNHEKLINAFCRFYDIYKFGKLIVTVSSDFIKIFNLLEEKKDLGYPIINIGFVNREDLSIFYSKSEYLIFPSLAESFGLGLIEAIELGCKVLGADLPYTYEVCNPSSVFNPFDEDSILKCFEKAVKTELKESLPKVNNQIEKLINLIQA
jgi:glycosyltransferase involved in cell wall biosynthesis